MNIRVPVLASAAAALAALLLSAWAWLEVPGATVLAGIGEDLEPVSKFRGLVIGPLLFIGIPIGLFLFLPRIEPRRGRQLAKSKAYSAIWIGVLMVAVLAHLSFVLRATGENMKVTENLLELSMPLLLMITGNYMTKIRSNFFIGIRTPWTLSSETSWRKTHRLGGRVLMLLGLALLPLAFITDATTNLWISTAAVVVIALLLCIYSYFAWRSDQPSS